MPREGHDSAAVNIRRGKTYFNPRAPRGARPAPNPVSSGGSNISIHVPREGHDFITRPSAPTTRHFNPRAPRGARPSIDLNKRISDKFQSTCPARGTTHHCRKVRGNPQISIHVPREGHDHQMTSTNGSQVYFNPRAPRGARQQTCTIFSCRFAQELQISR